MATIHFHPHPLTAARRAARRLKAGARTLEGMAARHWPFAAYGVLTVATAAYVVAQLARI